MRVGPQFAPIQSLRPDTPTNAFDCGQKDLNRYLRKHAWNNQVADISQTYVALADSSVAGYYSICAGGVIVADVPKQLREEWAPKYPMPAVLLARLAVDVHFQGMGLGAALLKDACINALKVADVVGVYVMAVHAKPDAVKWYSRFSLKFDPDSAGKEGTTHMFLPLREVRRRLSR